MTRAERIARAIWTNAAPGLDAQCSADDLAELILKIADDRVLMIGADIGRRIGRSPNTIGSWRERGQHRFPAPVYQTGMGPLWDSEDIEAWCAKYPKLVKASTTA